MKKFKQIVGETYDEDIVRRRLDQLGINHRYMYASGDRRYGIEVCIDGEIVKAVVEGTPGKWCWIYY